MEITPVNLDSVSAFDKLGEIDNQLNVNQSDFSNLIKTSFEEVNNSLVESDKAIEKFALGKAENIHEVVVAVEKAKISLQLAVEVRNKVVQAYQEILKMQV